MSFASVWMGAFPSGDETFIALTRLIPHFLPMRRALLASGLLTLLAGCVHVKLDPIEVNANVNVNVRLDKALNDFFGDLDKQSSTLAPAAK
jgi:hypothetical protein